MLQICFFTVAFHNSSNISNSEYNSFSKLPKWYYQRVDKVLSLGYHSINYSY